MNRTVSIALVAITASFCATPALAAEAVADGFARMLDHQPYHGPTATAPQPERDPLIAAVVLPLLRQQVADQRLAGVARRSAN